MIVLERIRQAVAYTLAAVWALLLSPLLFALPSEIDLKPYANGNIQAQLSPLFPVGHIMPPNNSFGVPFAIPENGNNFVQIDDERGNNPLSIKVGIYGVKKVFTLIQAFAPIYGQRLCSLEFIGSQGADQTVILIGGQNVRDFFESGFARTINNTTTRNAYELVGRGGAYTNNTTTGPRGFYNFDEQEFDLNADFATQTLDSIKFTALGNRSGSPLLLGATVVTFIELKPSFFSTPRFWLILGACVFVLILAGGAVGIRRWLNAP